MFFKSIKTGATRSRKNSFWQGVWILLPVLILAVIGLLSLRRERLIAETEARQRAAQCAFILTERLASELNPLCPLESSLVSLGQPASLDNTLYLVPENPELDLIGRYSSVSGDVQMCVIDEQGSLLYPPAYSKIPNPNPLDLYVLSSDQRQAWAELGSDSLDAYSRFMALKPPPPFAALAACRSALLMERSGKWPVSKRIWEDLAAMWPDVPNESGLPLGPLALWHLVCHAEPEDKEGSFNRLARSLLSYPSLLSLHLIERAQSLASESEPLGLTEISSLLNRWRQLWEMHESARQLYQAELQGKGLQSSVWLENPSRFVWQVSTSNRILVVVESESSISNKAQRLLNSASLRSSIGMPSYLGVRVLLGGRHLAGAELADAPLLATHQFSPVDGPEKAALPALEASIHLANGPLLFREQRHRTLWFACIILAATGAACWSWASAQRSFQRERQLNELKANFISSVSHELRAPIASMRLLAEGLLRGRAGTEEKRTDYLRFIVQESSRLGSLVENLLDFSRIEQGRKQYALEPTNLAALVNGTAAALQPVVAERQIRLAVQVSEDVQQQSQTGLCLDARAIQQALINLLDNAMKHAPPGTTVTIGADFLEPKAQESASSRPSGTVLIDSAAAWLALWVEDQGPGIPPEDHQRIFERFYRRGSELRRETQGAGIGLNIVRHIAEGHGGRVQVRSAPGQGSRFTLELPVLIAPENGSILDSQPLSDPRSHVTNTDH